MLESPARGDRRLDLLWELISGDVARLGYYLEAPGLSLSLRQKGVIRTNCIDCLDRTNVVQGWLARKQLEALLTRLSILPATSSLADAFPVVRHRPCPALPACLPPSPGACKRSAVAQHRRVVLLEEHDGKQFRLAHVAEDRVLARKRVG